MADNGDGTKTVTCPGSNPVTIANGENGANGADGTSCTSADNGDGTVTISCDDGTSVTVSNGDSCASTDNGDGTVTITCPNSSPVTIAQGSTCSLIDTLGVEVLTCSDGTRTILTPPIDTEVANWEQLPGVDLSIVAVGGGTNADGSFKSGDTIGVTYRVTTTGGRLIPSSELSRGGVFFSGPTATMQHVLPAARDQEMFTDILTAATLNDDGTYTYHFPAAIPASFGVPLYDTTKYTDGELTGALTAGTYRIGMTLSKDYTIDGQSYEDANSATRDVGLNTTTLTDRELVLDSNCENCHKDLRMHEGRFRSVDTCQMCHTAGAEDIGSTDTGDATPVTIDLHAMIHKLHDGAHLPSVNGLTTDVNGDRIYGTGVPYLVGTADFSTVQFPAFPNFNIALPKDAGYSALSSANRTKEDNVRKGVTDCARCHDDPDGAGPDPAPPQGAVAFQIPQRRACGACHDDIDWAKPYRSNGSTMPANVTDDLCSFCHNETQIQGYHLHPLQDPTVNPTIHVNLGSLTGGSGSGGTFLAGDKMTASFAITDSTGANLPITYLDSMTAQVTGPTQARQIVIPGLPGSPFDFAGRLTSASTTNKGSMSKVQPGGTTATETLSVDFSSATAFTVTGSVNGALGSAALPASPGTFPSGGSISNVVLTPTAVAQNITISFGGPTAYTVTGSVSGTMGTGVLPASTSNTQRFTSSDGTVSFNIVIGTTAPAAGNAFYMTIFKGAAANPVLFAVVGGRTAYAAGDRFFYDYTAPAASYSVKLPMDLPLELIGKGDGSTNQVFTAANAPVYYGRQTLLERTATPGTVMTTTKSASMMGRYLYVASLDPGVAANDFLVIDDGTGNEEYVKVGAVNASLNRIDITSGGGSSGYSTNPLRFTHGAGATVREVTFTFRQEGVGNYYTLNPAAGTVTLTGTSTAGNAFVMTYRTDAKFGWKRKAGDTVAPFYYSNLIDDPTLDDSWGDWRGKPLVDGTYTFGLWGFHAIEYRSGPLGAYEWQTYRADSTPATSDFLYGATATTVVPYSKIDNPANCDGCHIHLSFHGGSREGAETCLMCHATQGPGVSMRTLAHEWHGDTLPVMPNGAGACNACHGSTSVEQPTSRNHPNAQVLPSRDWGNACEGCHSSPAAEAHIETMTSTSSGYEACATCHDPDRDLAVKYMHQPR